MERTPVSQTKESSVDGRQMMEWTTTTPERVPDPPACFLPTAVPIPRSSSGNDAPANPANPLDPPLLSPSESEDDEPSTLPTLVFAGPRHPKSQKPASKGPKTNQRTVKTLQSFNIPRRAIPTPPAEFLNLVSSKLVVPRGLSLYYPGPIFYHRRSCDKMRVNNSWQITFPDWNPPPEVILSGPVNRSGGVNSFGDVQPAIHNSDSDSRSPLPKSPHRYILPKQRQDQAQ